MGLMFCASKGAVEQIVRVLSKDLGQRGSTVNAIAPGAVDTPLFRAGKPPQMMKWIADLNPQRRIPSPDEISPIVAFLASDDASWVNGQTIGVNGVSACCGSPGFADSGALTALYVCRHSSCDQ